MHEKILPFVSRVVAVPSPLIKKHTPVFLYLEGSKSNAYVRRVVRPPKLPNALPIGCLAPSPDSSTWDAFYEIAGKVGSDEVDGQVVLNDLYASWRSKAIPELCTKLQIGSEKAYLYDKPFRVKNDETTDC